MSGEGEVTEEAIKFYVSEKEVNTADLSVEVIMESVVSLEEEVKLNTPVTEPHLNICKCSPLLEEAWNPAAVISAASDNSDSECNNKLVT